MARLDDDLLFSPLLFVYCVTKTIKKRGFSAKKKGGTFSPFLVWEVFQEFLQEGHQ